MVDFTPQLIQGTTGRATRMGSALTLHGPPAS
jgi:hypothetical protein